MDRRSFIRMTLAGGAAGLIAPKLVLASDSLSSPMAGGVFYTKDAPGRWSQKVGGHLPSIEIARTADGKIEVKVATAHEMKGYEHYIIKHVLLNKDFGFIAEHPFNPTVDLAPVSQFTLDAYRGPLYALSECNKHDTWINVIEV